MKYSLEISKSILIDKLQDFKSANAAYLAAEHEFINFDLDHGTSDDFKSVQKKLQIARLDLEYCAVAFCKFLEANTDVLEDVPADAPEVVPVDALADVSEDSPAADPVVAPEDSPVMSAKCRLCPSCVDGRCFFVPDMYDSEFPCQSSAWDNFFKSGGSHGPAP